MLNIQRWGRLRLPGGTPGGAWVGRDGPARYGPVALPALSRTLCIDVSALALLTNDSPPEATFSPLDAVACQYQLVPDPNAV